MRRALFVLYLPRRALLLTAAFAAVSCGLILPILAIVGDLEGWLSSWTPWLFALAVGVSWSMLVSRELVPRRRGLSEFEAVLPVALRDLVLVRTLAFAIYWLMPVWVAFVVVLAIFAFHGRAAYAFTQYLPMVLSVSGCVLLAMTIHYRASSAKATPLRSALLSLVVLALMFVGFLVPTWWLAVLGFASSLLLAAILYRTTAESSGLDLPQTKRMNRAGSTGSRPYTLGWLVLDHYRRSWAFKLMLPCLVVMPIWTFFISAPFMWMQTIMFAVIATTSSLQLLRVVAHLPFSRRHLFAYMVVPPILVILLGSAVGYVAFGTLGLYQDIGYVARERVHDVWTYDIRVPANRWRITLGDPPSVMTPDGRSVRPTGYATDLGTVYNPYEVGEPGKELLSFQLSRLLQDCCRLELTPAQVETRYLSGDAWHGPYGGGLDSDDHPELSPSRSLSSFALYMFIVVLLTLVGFSLLFRDNQPAATRGEWVRRWAATLVGPVAIWVAGFALLLNVRWSSAARPDEPPLLGPLWNLVESFFAGHTILAVSVSMLMVAGLYLLLQRRFEQMEPPAAQPNTVHARLRLFVDV